MPRVLAHAAIAALALGTVAAAAWTRLRDDRALLEAVAGRLRVPGAPVEEEEEGPYLDLEHLTDRDLAFLAGLLEGEEAAPRASAMRVLEAAADPRGIPLLLAAARRRPEEADAACSALLAILRGMRPEAQLEVLVAALVDPPPEPCRADLAARYALVRTSVEDPGRLLARHRDPGVRAFAARLLAGRPDARPLLEELAAADPAEEVRRAAALALEGAAEGPSP